jgi:short-subunit dehydrogenase involved in D-alanine esterification of teichoic acids
MKLENHVVFITGGASGIGLALARELLRRNNTVIVSGRNAAKLAEVSQRNAGLHTIQSDVTDFAQAKAAIDAIVKQFGRLSILVNNAGIMMNWDMLRENDPAHLEGVDREVATNYVAPIKLTMLALPVLLQQKDAAVVNIASGVAYTPMGRYPVYCGTKAALHSFSKSLRYQLEKTPVRVFDVLPPRTSTDLNAEMKEAKTSAETVAKKMLRGMERDHYEIPIGESKALQIMERIAPGILERRMLRLGESMA